MSGWRIAAICSAVAIVIIWGGMELLQSIYDRKRVEKTGIGGTQDIAMWGMLALGVAIVFEAVCLTMIAFGH